VSGRGHKASRKASYGGDRKRFDEEGRRRAEGFERMHDHDHEPKIVIDQKAKPKDVQIRDGRTPAR
jgi:hypothetical protein